MLINYNNPYARGILRVAPIKESVETSNLTVGNIRLGTFSVADVGPDNAGVYYIKIEEWFFDDITNAENSRLVYKKVKLPDDYKDNETYYTYNNDGDLLEPVQDILDICYTNPSSITYNKNTSSSENSGRTQGSSESGVYLNMHKDILGRVRELNISFPPMFKEKYMLLDNLFMNKTELVSEKSDDGSTNEEGSAVEKYIIWYYVECLIPEEGGIVADLYYVGDSSFTDIDMEYKNMPYIHPINGTQHIIPRQYAKNVKVNLIGKNAIKGLTNI